MKIAIVTGASSGMGKEFVRQIERFYRELDEIWVIARSEKKLEEIKKSHKTYPDLCRGHGRGSGIQAGEKPTGESES